VFSSEALLPTSLGEVPPQSSRITVVFFSFIDDSLVSLTTGYFDGWLNRHPGSSE
jgi:hypothetical protein